LKIKDPSNIFRRLLTPKWLFVIVFLTLTLAALVRGESAKQKNGGHHPTAIQSAKTPQQGDWISANLQNDKMTAGTALIRIVGTLLHERMVDVSWQIENTAMAPLTIFSNDMYLIDLKGRIFSPVGTHDSYTLQPTESSPGLLRSRYQLPKAIDATTLSWGKIDPITKQVLFKIRLRPIELENIYNFKCENGATIPCFTKAHSILESYLNYRQKSDMNHKKKRRRSYYFDEYESKMIVSIDATRYKFGNRTIELIKAKDHDSIHLQILRDGQLEFVSVSEGLSFAIGDYKFAPGMDLFRDNGSYLIFSEYCTTGTICLDQLQDVTVYDLKSGRIFIREKSMLYPKVTKVKDGYILSGDYEGISYHLTKEGLSLIVNLKKQTVPPEKELEEVVSTVQSEVGQNDGLVYPNTARRLRAIMEKMIVGGNGDLAIDLIDRAWPSFDECKDYFVAKILENMREKPYWPQVIALNGISSEIGIYETLAKEKGPPEFSYETHTYCN